jgi:hypothetical protein
VQGLDYFLFLWRGREGGERQRNKKKVDGKSDNGFVREKEKRNPSDVNQAPGL